MKNKLYKILCLAVALVIIVGNFSTASAQVPGNALQAPTTYYVSPTGNDKNAGTEAAPWLTVKKALATIKAGDTLILRGGQYDSITAGWYLANSGTPSQPITITNYPGEQVILRAPAATTSGNYVIKCTPNSGVTPKADYVKIIGRDVTPRQLPNGVTSQKGIVMTGPIGSIAPAVMSIDCDFWEVAGVDFVDVAYGIFTRKINHGLNSADNWYVHNNRVYGYFRESGMQFNGNYNVIENNEIYKVNNRLDTPYGCQLLNLLGNNNVVRGNTLSRLGSTARCIGILLEWDLADSNLIENNTISEVPNGIGFLGGDNNTIRNNRLSGTDTAFVVHSYADNVTAYPCNFTEIAPYDTAEYVDRGYYYPHDCRSKNNQITGNTVTGFSSQLRAQPLQESSTVYVPAGATQTPAPTLTATKPAAFTATPTATATLIPATATATPTQVGPTAVPATATATPIGSTAVPSATPQTQVTNTPLPPNTAVPTFTSTAIPTFTLVPNMSSVTTVITPKNLIIGQTATVTVSLNTLPVEGYTAAEFTCSYTNGQLTVSNIQIGTLFGPDPVSTYTEPKNGSFIFAIAGSNGNKATTAGPVFSFTVTALQAGQTPIECKARVLRGNNVLESIASVSDSLTIAGNAPTSTSIPTTIPTSTPIPAPVLNGRVTSTKPVTISLFRQDATLVTSVPTNPDGTFSLTASAGIYIVVASAEGYLNAQGTATLADGIVTTLPLIILPAGDIDGNDVIDQYDAMTVGMSYNVSAPSTTDLSNDNLTNIFDLEMLADNYRKSGSLAWK